MSRARFLSRLASWFRPFALPLNSARSPKLPPPPILESLEDRRVMNNSFFAVGAASGQSPLVKLYSADERQFLGQIQAFDTSFTGGVRVALADLNEDHVPDLVVAAGAGGGPHIKVFDGATRSVLASFYAFETSYGGGLNIAAGDIGNGRVGIVAATDGGRSPEVRVFLPDGTLAKSFLAYDGAFTGGVKVALGYGENGNAAIVTAAGLGGGPHVKVFESRSLDLKRSFFAYDAGFQGGVHLAASDLNGDGVSEIVTGPGSGGGPQVKVFQRAGQSLLTSFIAGSGDAAIATLVGASTTTAKETRLTALVKQPQGDLLRSYRLNANGSIQEVGSGLALAAAGIGTPSDRSDAHRFHRGNAAPNVLTRSYKNDSAAPSSGYGSDMYSANPIRYNDGSPELNIPLTDDSGVFGDILDYTNKLDYTTGQHVGVGWLYSGTPAAVKDGTNLRIVLSASEVLTFADPVIDEETYSTSHYKPEMGVTDTIEYDPTNKQYLLTRGDGTKYRFFDFLSWTAANKRGTIDTIKDPGGNTVYEVTARDGSDRISTIERSIVQDGTTIKTRRTLSYISGGANDGFISQIVFDKKIGSGSWTTSRTTTLDYYSGTSDSGGRDNELKLVTVKDASDAVLSRAYFRYWLSGQTNGYNQAVKYVLYGANYDRMVQAGYTPTTATNAQLDGFANHYFEYDDQFRANKEIAAGNGTFTNTFTTNPNGLSTSDFNYWNVKTVETQPDGHQKIVFTNFQKQPILSIFKNTTTSTEWIDYTKYTSVGYVSLTANPSAMTGYSEGANDLVSYSGGNAAYISDSAGLVTNYAYGSSTTATASTAGNAQDYLQSVSIRRGETGTSITQQAVDYFKRTVNGVDLFVTASNSRYRNTDGTGNQTTNYAYTWQGSTAQPEKITVTLPTVTTAQNGSNSATSTETVYNAYGQPIWIKDASGFLTYLAYDLSSGALTKRIDDVDTTQTTTFTNLPSGWSTPSGGGAHLTTLYEVDQFGRTTKVTHPSGRIDYTVFNDAAFEVRTYPAWDATANAPLLPISVYRQDKARGYSESLTMTATPTVSSGRPTGAESISNLQTLSRMAVNDKGQVVTSDAYFNLTGVSYSASSVALGTAGTNYYRTEYGYDAEGNRVRTLSPTGTITRSVKDAQNRDISIWVGLDDTPTSGVWSPTNTSGTDLVKIREYEYGDLCGCGPNLIQLTEIPGGSEPNRVTKFYNDWRNRVVAKKFGVETTESTDTNRQLVFYDLDNLSNITKTRIYDGDTVTLSYTSGTPNAPSSSLLRSQTENLFDELGRSYRTLTYSVNPSDGSVGSYTLAANSWYDAKGQLIKTSSPGGLITKYAYDGLGRNTKIYTTDGGGDSAYTDADDVTGDLVLEQVENTYNSASQVILVTSKRHFHDDTGTGDLGTATTGNKARVSYAANYFDGADRITATVNVGTNGGSAYTRPSTVPSRSDTALVTSYAYAGGGWLQDTTDPKGLVTRATTDNLGRVTKQVENYTNGTVTDTSNKTTEFTYNAVGRTMFKVVLPSSGQQVTEWVYGVTTGSGSTLNSNDLVKEVRYPDATTGASSSTDKDTITVNALGQKLTVTDRNGNTHSYSYDIVGRQTADAVTTLGSGVDGAVRRIVTAYDGQGNANLVTSYDAASGGNVVNQVKRDYNGLRQLTREWQEHNGAVTGSSASVQYAYSEMSGGANHSRLTQVTYASGYALNYNYGSGLDSTISRLTSLSDSGNTLESLTYLGRRTLVKRAHPQSGVDLTYIKLSGEATTDAGDQYTGLDRFNRIIDQRWINTSNADVDRFKYGYDRNGNRTYKENVVLTGLSEVYTNDDLNQLASFKLGTLNGTKTDVTGTPTKSQTRDYDATGNWDSITTNGVTQTREANRQNEITSVSGATTPTYDNNGNLTRDENNFRFVFDAWNRQAKIKNASDTVITTNEFDGLNRKVEVTASGVTFNRIFNFAWQLIEEKSGANTKNRYVWSPAYIDALVTRDRDTDANGTLDERLFAQHDANFNVTAITNTSGTVQERYTPDPFGVVTFRDASGNTISASAKDWVFLHQGGQADILGHYDFRNRILSPTLGRWQTNDPLVFAGGLGNLTNYIGNNPLLYVDPHGFIAGYADEQDLTFLNWLCDKAKKGGGQMTWTRKEFEELYEKETGRPLPPGFSRNIDAGCIGITSEIIGKDIYSLGPKYEFSDTTCFRTKKEAEDYECKGAIKKVVWSKQGAWRPGFDGSKEPDPWKRQPDPNKRGKVPQDSIIGSPEYTKPPDPARDEFQWNYVTQIGDCYFDMNNAAKVGPQVIRVCTFPPKGDVAGGNGTIRWPSAMWCVTCINPKYKTEGVK